MNRLAAGECIRWLVSTSRRTGAAAERILRGSLDPAHLAHTIWWSENPEKRLPALLGSAEAVFVTQDSVTMVTEALASGKPVVVVAPAVVRFPAGSFLPDYFDRLSRQGLFRRCEASRIGNLSAADFAAPPDTAAYEDQLADALLKRLGFVGGNA
jgi:mitochondrial fission protein ELM1